MCASLHKLAAVTIGQSPRPDMWDEIAQSLDFSFQADQFGVMDDETALAELRRNEPDSHSLVTRLRDGKAIWISSQGLRKHMASLISRIVTRDSYDAVVLLCTGIREIDCEISPPVLYPGRMINKGIVKNAGTPVGIVLPDEKQMTRLIPGFPAPDIITVELPPPGSPGLYRAAARMLETRGAACIAFHCMGYPLKALALFTTFSKSAVFHPRQLLTDELNRRFRKEKSPDRL